MEDGRVTTWEPGRIQDTERQGYYQYFKNEPRSAEMSARHRSKVRRSVKVPSPKWRLRLRTQFMMLWACASWICRSRRRKFFVRCKPRQRKTKRARGQEAATEDTLGVEERFRVVVFAGASEVNFLTRLVPPTSEFFARSQIDVAPFKMRPRKILSYLFRINQLTLSDCSTSGQQ